MMREEDTGVFHASRLGAAFAARLVAHGAPEDLRLAERVLAAVRGCQEVRPGDPHLGNFRWEMEDEGVEDLNGVHFVLIELIPMMVRFEDRLSPACRASLRESIRIALEEIARLDVGLDYTNIVLKDIANTILGAEVLGRADWLERGKAKFLRWLRFTYRSGGVFEINSPVYTPVALRVLHILATHTRDEDVAVRARMSTARIGLSYALRVHPRTGRLAGPFCRAYRAQVLGDLGSERAYIETAVRDHGLPAWALDVAPTLPAQIAEGYDADRGLTYTSWLSPSFSMGTAAAELDSQANRFIAGQSNVFTMNFTAPQSPIGGMVFTRYILDDKWLGDFRSTSARPSNDLLLDEGRFFGVQEGSRCLGVYAPREMGAWNLTSSAKLAIVISRRAYVNEIAVNGRPAETLPADVPEGAVVCFGFDQAMLAVRSFTRTDLGRGAPLRIVERGGDLVFEIYNYLGPKKTFWELACPGSFYRGQPRCGFYAEAAERAEAGSLAAFSKTVTAGAFVDEADPVPGSAGRDGPRVWKLGYARGDHALALEVDLMRWALLKRSGRPPYTLLDSPVAKQGRGHVLDIAGAALDPGGANAWSYGCRETDTWVAGGLADPATDLAFSLPRRTLRVHGFRFGTVTVRGQTVALDANREASWAWDP